MKKALIFTLLLALFLTSSPLAFAINNPVLPINEPTVSNITTNSAEVAVSRQMLNALSEEQKSGLYFEYIQTNQVCIMIYPTPEHCLPKKTTKGLTSVVLKDLNPNTSYTLSYKVDNTIACITAPCNENGLQSASIKFSTTATDTNMLFSFYRNLQYRSRGNDVRMLQDILRQKGYLSSVSTGYFGTATFRAVKAFQKDYMKIPPTGFVGPKTRLALNNILNVQSESFEGTIQSVSTACFADGECSVTIDGKKVITTIGWSQEIVGSIKGTVNSIGDIETSKIGTQAKVYARKLLDGSYTLYGNSSYYIEVL
jgi:peptidoglycan hydrolase-like protein with peptidoglycan-binding domain